MKKTIILTTLLTLLPISVKADTSLIGIQTSNFHSYRPYFSLSISHFHTSKEAIFHANENHHLYWGSCVYLSGIIFKSKSIKYLGATITIDDILQHTLEIDSPFHMLNNELGRWKCYRNFVNRF